MAHARQQILDAVVTAVTGLPLTGSNVHLAPVHALRTLPALSVLPGDEEVIERAAGTTPLELRSFQVKVTAGVMDELGMVTTLNDIAAGIEAAVLKNAALLALVSLIEYVGATPDFSGELQQPTGTIETAFRAEYWVETGAPETVVH